MIAHYIKFNQIISNYIKFVFCICLFIALWALLGTKRTAWPSFSFLRPWSAQFREIRFTTSRNGPVVFYRECNLSIVIYSNLYQFISFVLKFTKQTNCKDEWHMILLRAVQQVLSSLSSAVSSQSSLLCTLLLSHVVLLIRQEFS